MQSTLIYNFNNIVFHDIKVYVNISAFYTCFGCSKIAMLLKMLEQVFAFTGKTDIVFSTLPIEPMIL